MSTCIRSGREILLERRDQFFRLVMVERAVKQIHADDAERFLLIDVRFVEHPDVNDDLARFAARLALETHPEPAVRFVVLLETARRDRVGENKKRPLVRRAFRSSRSINKLYS